jgi:hypothetical protein
MAKTLAANSFATIFADHFNTVILDGIGPKNENGVPATTYTAVVPESCVPHLKELKQWTNNNWEKLLKEHNGSVTELLADLPNIAATFEPKEPKAQSPGDRAVMNILCRLNPTAVAGLSGASLVKATKPDVERFKVSASVEKYQSQYEAEYIAVTSATDKRSLRGEDKPDDAGVGFVFETDDAATAD